MSLCMMEQDRPPEQDVESSGRESEDAIIMKNPQLWRKGPASHIYDQLGIPEASNCLDYNLVFQRKEHDIRDFGNEKQCLLDLAVHSIIPQDNTKKCKRGNCVPKGHAQQRYAPYQPNQQQNTAFETICTSQQVFRGKLETVEHICRPLITSGPSTSIANSKDSTESEDLKQAIFQLEDSTAICTLERELELNNLKDDLFNRQRVAVHEEKPKSSDHVKQNPEADNHSLVTQLAWENDIIWDIPNDLKVSCKHVDIERGKTRAGWIPTKSSRKATSGSRIEAESESFKSILPYENEELVAGSWEEEVIWNADDFGISRPRPKLLVFDATDDNIVFQMPTDIPMPESTQQSVFIPKRQLNQPHTMKSKLILGKAGFIRSKWKREQLKQQAREIREKMRSSPLKNIVAINSQSDWTVNISLSSNDEFYKSKVASPISVLNGRHSRLIKESVPPFILTHLSSYQLRNFHRPKLSLDSDPTKISGEPTRYYFKSLSKRIKAKSEEYKKLMSAGQSIIFDKEIDLSARDGTIILVENCEEYPCLLSQVGMCSQIVNYYKHKSPKEEAYSPTMPHPFGETKFVSGSSNFPFLGTLESCQILSSIGNLMYHSPIYWHGKNETDFLVIGSTMSCFLIRDLDGLFVGGQQCPLIDVPAPNSNKLRNFLRKFVQAFVYRKYRSFSPNDPATSTTGSSIPKVRMDVITQNFPTLNPNHIKSILKNSSKLKRIKNVSWMVMKSEFLLPDVEQLADMVSPEQICAYYSLLASQQRLRDAGFDSMLALLDRSQEDDGKKGRKTLNPYIGLLDPPGLKKQQNRQQIVQSGFNEEILSAPWNTTSAFIAAATGKCFLQVSGQADPTGCGEGFSYVRVAKRGSASGNQGHGETARKYSGQGHMKKHLQKTRGTDADLRKLSSKSAKELLKSHGVPEKEIQKLTRWEIIDLVRTLSTEKVIQGEATDKMITKFCRFKNIHSLAMNQERYNDECQRVFELQNIRLSSTEVLSTDDDESDDDNAADVGETRTMDGASKKDIEVWGKNIESILNGNTDIDWLADTEELERLVPRQVPKLTFGGIMAKDADIARKKEALENASTQTSNENSQDTPTDLIRHHGRVLKITRTFECNGESFVRIEIVSNPVVIAAYVRIRSSRNEEFIRKFLENSDRKDKNREKQRDKVLLNQWPNKVEGEERKVIGMQRKRKREMGDHYTPNQGAEQSSKRSHVNL